MYDLVEFALPCMAIILLLSFPVTLVILAVKISRLIREQAEKFEHVEKTLTLMSRQVNHLRLSRQSGEELAASETAGSTVETFAAEKTAEAPSVPARPAQGPTPRTKCATRAKAPLELSCTRLKTKSSPYRAAAPSTSGGNSSHCNSGFHFAGSSPGTVSFLRTSAGQASQ
jgi:hypothetical protein